MVFPITIVCSIISTSRVPLLIAIPGILQLKQTALRWCFSMGKQIKRLSRSSSAGKTREQFDYRLMDDFYDKSLSEHTRRAYRRVVREFFTAHRKKHPSEINAKQVQAWRDALIRKRQKPATINFKLSVVRSFFEY